MQPWLTLVPADFGRVFSAPRGVVIGMLNLASLSFAIAKLSRLSDSQSTAIALELGIHNSALAIAIGASLAAEVMISAAVYSSFMLFTGGAFAWAMSRRNAPRTQLPG